MSIALATRGFYGVGGPIVGDSPSVITITATPTISTDPFIVEIYDEVGFSLYEITCRDDVNGPKYTVYDSIEGDFLHPFGGKSTVSGSGTLLDPYIFTVYRRGGWPTGLAFDIQARAVDSAGNEVEA